MSTVEGGGNVITDGLVFYTDAGNTKSYISGSTTWADLSRGEYNTILINGPTFNFENGGSIVFDGVNDRISKTGSINTGQNFTVNAWIYPTNTTTQRAIIGNGYTYSLRRGWLFAISSYGPAPSTFFLSIGSDKAYRVASGNSLSLNTWQYVTATVTSGGGTITLYVNGVPPGTYVSSLSTDTILYNGTEFNIGMRASNDPRYYLGRIAQTSIYNRALSSSEVLQNYNATRARFGV